LNLAPLTTLGIETSCDETAVGLYHRSRGLLGHALFSQVDMHAEHGGVVPELASRDHVRKLIPLIEQLMTECSITADDLEGVAYTRGPGLIGALMVGSALAQTLAWSWELPILAVHHLEGHLLAPLLSSGPTPSPPFLSLLVSGGHTMLIEVVTLGSYRILGETLDDAVGEAFDKRPLTMRWVRRLIKPQNYSALAILAGQHWPEQPKLETPFGSSSPGR